MAKVIKKSFVKSEVLKVAPKKNVVKKIKAEKPVVKAASKKGVKKSK